MKKLHLVEPLRKETAKKLHQVETLKNHKEHFEMIQPQETHAKISSKISSTIRHKIFMKPLLKEENLTEII